jgi:signal peptidase I
MSTSPDRRRSWLRDCLDAVLIAVVLALFSRTYVFQAFRIPSESMVPNLLVGDHILVNKFVFSPTATGVERGLLPQRPLRRGDIVVFRSIDDPGRHLIKRCMGLPGDRVEIRRKALFINGERLDERGYAYFSDPLTHSDSRFLVGDFYRTRDEYGPEVVPAGHYFCLGDNRDASSDSRHWGPVPAKYVRGRAFAIYWSYAARPAPGPGPETHDKMTPLRQALSGFWDQTRWERTFRLVR